METGLPAGYHVAIGNESKVKTYQMRGLYEKEQERTIHVVLGLPNHQPGGLFEMGAGDHQRGVVGGGEGTDHLGFL